MLRYPYVEFVIVEPWRFLDSSARTCANAAGLELRVVNCWLFVVDSLSLVVGCYLVVVVVGGGGVVVVAVVVVVYNVVLGGIAAMCFLTVFILMMWLGVILSTKAPRSIIALHILHRRESRGAQLPKGGLVWGHDKPIHGSCAIYFPGGIFETTLLWLGHIDAYRFIMLDRFFWMVHSQLMLRGLHWHLHKFTMFFLNVLVTSSCIRC